MGVIVEQHSYKSSIRPLCNDLLDLRLQNTANPVQFDSEYFNGSLFLSFPFLHIYFCERLSDGHVCSYN